ncbi:MAG: Fis family transcriptional regulator [Arcobacter sp.]|nr:Fis family transcriptional regulator [Arcobacter sp.]
MFFSNCEKIKQIKKGFELTRNMQISTLLYGEANIGKKTLVKSIYNNAIWVDGNDFLKVKNAFLENSEVVIYNFDIHKNYDADDFNSKKIVAIANETTVPGYIDSLFGFIYKMPSLKERPEDLKFFVDKYTKEANENLAKEDNISFNIGAVDISDNIRSLKIDIYKKIAFNNLEKNEIQDILYNYFKKNLHGNNDYVKFLNIFEYPLIKAGLDKFGSQLKLSQILGINRNTLRKKVNENGID